MTVSSHISSNRIKVGSKYIGEGEPTFFIAEIGNNHNGDYYLAKRTIDEAVASGADAVKFQKRCISDVFARELREKPQTKDQVLGKTYGEYRQALELSMEEFLGLKKHAEGLGVLFFATPFDHKSADFLEEVGMDVYKIASFDVTNLPLLSHVAKKGKPMFLSSGMSTLDELDEAVNTVLRHHSNLIIKHCVSIYPTPDDKFNLLTIPFLKERYHPLPIGYSGHEQDYIPTLAAIALGAKSVERHITIDKSLPGPDHATVSINPQEFKEMITATRRIEKALGERTKILMEDEKKVREKHTKSIVSRTSISKGTVIAADMLMCKSPGYGLKPNMIDTIIGKTAKSDIGEDTVITADHIEW